MPSASQSLSTMATPSSTTVLVTGGSGFIGSYVILALLSAGYIVRTTVRSLSREAGTRSAIKTGGATASDLERLSFVVASLDSDVGWAEAVQDCTYVHHLASPFPAELPKHEDELIIPAREGTLRVLKAAASAGVKRVVLTSSIAAVAYGHVQRKEPFTEEDWTVMDNNREKVAPYIKSKTIAERAAWDFINSDTNNNKMELAVVLPSLVAGPILGKEISTSVEVIKRLIDGMPGCPNLSFSIVDVRDVASIHFLAMTKSDAAGQRFLASNSDPAISMLEIGKIIKANRPQNAKKVPSIQIPNFLVHALAFFEKPIRQILPDLGKVMQISNQKARESLGWQPRGTETSIIDTADSLVKNGLV